MKLTEAEWQIMKALWKGFPANTRQVAERLPAGTNWAYTTIKTMLTRLADKKAVRESKLGKTALYEPLLTQANARKNALKGLMDQAFDGAFGPMMHFLLENQKLSPKQRDELMAALKEDGTEKKGGSK